jgi:ribose 5-phosphate isomerase B
LLTRLHNDANSIPARFTSIPQAVEIVETFLETKFEGGIIKMGKDKIALKIELLRGI